MKKIPLMLFIFLLSFSLYDFNVQAEMVSTPTPQRQDPNMMSVLWFQTSGEAKALYYQGYNIGKMRLDQILAEKRKKKNWKPAIVLDIDETILDNSPCLAFNVQKGKAFPVNFNKWVKKANAQALPGAVEFLKYANSKGIEIYYISNRNVELKKATILNLKQVGAPMADADHVLLQKQGENGKETRRKLVAKTHDIILLFGDNLGDFSGFDDLTASRRALAAEDYKREFGKKLIVFPNPMYGDWEAAIYNYDYNKTDLDKAKLRNESLKPFNP